MGGWGGGCWFIVLHQQWYFFIVYFWLGGNSKNFKILMTSKWQDFNKMYIFVGQINLQADWGFAIYWLKASNFNLCLTVSNKYSVSFMKEFIGIQSCSIPVLYWILMNELFIKLTENSPMFLHYTLPWDFQERPPEDYTERGVSQTDQTQLGSWIPSYTFYIHWHRKSPTSHLS